jgi:hypothetical protein
LNALHKERAQLVDAILERQLLMFIRQQTDD